MVVVVVVVLRVLQPEDPPTSYTFSSFFRMSSLIPLVTQSTRIRIMRGLISRRRTPSKSERHLVHQLGKRQMQLPRLHDTPSRVVAFFGKGAPPLHRAATTEHRRHAIPGLGVCGRF